MEAIIFYMLLEQVDLGKRVDSRFEKEAEMACYSAIKSAIRCPITVDKCKGKVDIMKALQRELNWLKEQSGFR